MTEVLTYPFADSADAPAPVKFPLTNLIPEIASKENLESAFDYVVSHLDVAEQRDHIRPHKTHYVNKLASLISTGTFRITPKDFRTLEVTDGYKKRIVQCPTVFHRVGVHAIMVVFEKYVYPHLITNTAASIKGKGMHWLFHTIEDDIANVPEQMKYFYECDIHHYYDSINQRKMESQLMQITTDKILLPMLFNFVELLPEDEGLSKGLRSSQCFANIHLNHIDHEMCHTVTSYTITDEGVKEVREAFVGVGLVESDGKVIRYLYYRYCDDFRIYSSDKKVLWRLRDKLKAMLSELGLEIKKSEAVRPLKVGDDFLGFVNFGTHARVRKRTKKKFARAIHHVKSRKRRKKLVGSFFGMASHADCRNLLKKLLAPSEYKRLKHKRKMKDFSEFKIAPTTIDGKKNLRGTRISPRELDKQSFIVVDFDREGVARRDKEEYRRKMQDASARGADPSLVEKPKKKYILQIIYNGALRKLWTGDRDIWSILEQIDANDGFPFFVAIEMDYSSQYPKANFVSPSKFGHRMPTDEEVDRLLKQFNLI